MGLVMKHTENCKNTDTVNVTPVNHARRKGLLGLVATGAVVSVWQKPTLQAVVLPAHAQTSTTDLDFFATVADASEVTQNASLFDFMVQPAHALLSTNEEPLSELKFEAEAISQGGGTYKISIAADHDNVNGKAASSSTNFIFAWQGTISGLNTNAPLTGSGCAQNESARITSIGANSLSLEMSYFSKTISLNLSDGSASLPSLPLAACN